jgi:hypothetical protein
MAKQPFTTPVRDTVPKVDDTVAVGEDLRFQRRWWTFEKLIWKVFLVLIIADLLGLFGHGWLAKGKASTPDGALSIDYERVERASTPSTMTLHFGPGAIRDDRIRVHVSNTVVKGLGAQRIAPQPATSAIGEDGIDYEFPATGSPAQVEIQLQPTTPGLQTFRIRIPDRPAIEARVLIMP